MARQPSEAEPLAKIICFQPPTIPSATASIANSQPEQQSPVTSPNVKVRIARASSQFEG